MKETKIINRIRNSNCMGVSNFIGFWWGKYFTILLMFLALYLNNDKNLANLYGLSFEFKWQVSAWYFVVYQVFIYVWKCRGCFSSWNSVLSIIIIETITNINSKTIAIFFSFHFLSSSHLLIFLSFRILTYFFQFFF